MVTGLYSFPSHPSGGAGWVGGGGGGGGGGGMVLISNDTITAP